MNSPTNFAEVLACVETMPLGDQAVLLDVLNKRFAAARRHELLTEIAQARADYSRGKMKRGTAVTLMRELRHK